MLIAHNSFFSRVTLVWNTQTNASNSVYYNCIYVKNGKHTENRIVSKLILICMPLHDGFNLRRPVGELLKGVGFYHGVCLLFAVSPKSKEKVM